MDLGNAYGMVDTYLPTQIILMRLAVAAGLGAIIGFEREIKDHAAGLRTHILIALAAALFTILTFEIYHTLEVPQGQQGPQADPIRAVEAVTAGIAFLGAGAIFRGGASVHGLTTAAGMWLAGAVGVSAALGYYLIAACVSLLAIVVLWMLKAIARKTLS